MASRDSVYRGEDFVPKGETLGLWLGANGHYALYCAQIEKKSIASVSLLLI